MGRTLAFFVLSLLPLRAVSVTTAQVDNTRGSYNSSETVLTPSNVATGSFYLTGSYNVDGAVYAQPLVVPATVGGVSRQCLLIATMNGTIYCMDALSPGATLWSTHVSAPLTSFIPAVSNFFYMKPVGCLSTPVIDVPNNRVYAVCATNTPSWVLYSLNLSTGAVVTSVTITGTVTGTGCVGTTPADKTSGANLLFYDAYELQRAPLTLTGTTVMIAFTAWDDKGPWHGWAFTYDMTMSPPAQVNLWNSTPNGCGGGIWEAGGGPALDGTAYYFATGNGDWDGTANFGMSIVKLTAALAVSDYWTPSNYATLNSEDADLSSGRVMVIPSSGFVTFGSKDFYVRLVNESSMGHLAAAPAQQFLTNPSPPTPGGGTGVYGGAYANGIGYFPNVGGKLYSFSYSSGSYNTTPVTTSGTFASVQGMTISDNSGSNGILWAVTTASSAYASQVAGTLRALNPSTLTEYWNSGSLVGNVSKFSSPTVANGRVYLGTTDNVVRMFSNTPPSVQSGVSVTVTSWVQH